MRPPRRLVQTYGMEQSRKLGSTLRVDVVDMLGDGMNMVAAAVHNNNVNNRANASILVEFRPKPKGDRFDSFVVQVTEAVSMMERSISVLRLWAHAYVFDLRDEVPTGEAILGDKPFTVEHVRLRRTAFAHLRPFFSRHPATRFEFRGCGVANLVGLDLMKELASLWGIRVHAAERAQASGMDWEGQVVEALPDGTLQDTVGLPYDSPY
jgi:hypothetical protein